MSYDPGRQGSPWWQARARRLKTARENNEPCGICHGREGPLDYRREVDGGPARYSPNAVVIDHIVPLQHGGDPLDQANLRPAHNRCNIGRGNQTRHGHFGGAVPAAHAKPDTDGRRGWYCNPCGCGCTSGAGTGHLTRCGHCARCPHDPVGTRPPLGTHWHGPPDPSSPESYRARWRADGQQLDEVDDQADEHQPLAGA